MTMEMEFYIFFALFGIGLLIAALKQSSQSPLYSQQDILNNSSKANDWEHTSSTSLDITNRFWNTLDITNSSWDITENYGNNEEDIGISLDINLSSYSLHSDDTFSGSSCNSFYS